MYYTNPNQHIRQPFPQQSTPFSHSSQPNHMMPPYQQRPFTVPNPYQTNHPFPTKGLQQGLGQLPLNGRQRQIHRHQQENIPAFNQTGQPQSRKPKGLKLGLPKKNQQKEGNLTMNSPSFLKQAFTSQDGKFDLSQTIQTVEQVTKAVSEMSPIVQQVSSFFTKK